MKPPDSCSGLAGGACEISRVARRKGVGERLQGRQRIAHHNAGNGRGVDPLKMVERLRSGYSVEVGYRPAVPSRCCWCDLVAELHLWLRSSAAVRRRSPPLLPRRARRDCGRIR